MDGQPNKKRERGLVVGGLVLVVAQFSVLVAGPRFFLASGIVCVFRGLRFFPLSSVCLPVFKQFEK